MNPSLWSSLKMCQLSLLSPISKDVESLHVKKVGGLLIFWLFQPSSRLFRQSWDKDVLLFAHRFSLLSLLWSFVIQEPEMLASYLQILESNFSYVHMGAQKSIQTGLIHRGTFYFVVVRIFWQIHCSRSYKKTARLVRTFWNSCHLDINFWGFAARMSCSVSCTDQERAWRGEEESESNREGGQWEQSWGEVTEEEEGNCKSEASGSDKGLVAVLVMLISSSFNVWGSFWSSLSPCLDLFRAEVEGAVTANHSCQERVVLCH